MLELIGVSYLTSIFYSVSAILLLFLCLKWLDKSNGRPWKDSIKIIRKDSHATAIYYAARWLGACILVGLVMSR